MAVMTCKKTKSSRTMAGFTLIEALIALAIIAIALAASLRASGSLALGGRALHERLLAGFSADNVLAQLRLEHTWLPLGAVNFPCAQGNADFICIRTVSATPNPSFRRVDIVVKQVGLNSELAHLMTVIANETQRPL
ncbi:MAG: general secretion pathway protein I [Glomeribacter sp. 1016415]|nr:general secretion pathway protein I [Glomeribacter sp. 1016415]